MSDLAAFWLHDKTPKSYDETLNKAASGVIDERIIEKYINNYLPRENKIVIDLGVGPGRELVWLDNVLGVKKIIGLDYSLPMLRFLEKEKHKYKHSIETLHANLLKPFSTNLKKGEIAIYLSLINSMGNFSHEERIIVFKNIKAIMKSQDIFIVALYKRTQHAKLNDSLKELQYLQTEREKDQQLLAEIIEYCTYSFFWNPVIDKYHTLPRFWYDQKSNDVVIHVDGKRLFTSHRFSKEEIGEEFKTAGLKIDKLIEGKAMWIAVGKI
jgi:hypothetical protein